MAKEKIDISCDNCDAAYQIVHAMDDDMYRPSHCSFCGEELLEEDNFLLNGVADEEEENEDNY